VLKKKSNPTQARMPVPHAAQSFLPVLFVNRKFDGAVN
jgi:hypothetical protein